MGLLFAIVGSALVVWALVPMFQVNPKPFGSEIFVGGIILCVSVVAIIGTIHAGLKKCVLAVVGDQLLTFETGLLGSRRREFTRDELLDIDCGPSGVTVNKKRLPQLRIWIRGRTMPVGMLTGRDEIELKWIATVLRQSLGISGVPPEYRKLTLDSTPGATSL